jgi:dTDP-4-dehydrorhamnose 3,5-epimerase
LNFTPLGVAGMLLVEPQRFPDERGFFARTYCAREFAAHGATERFVQSSVSFNRRAGTIRGLHWQEPPHQEAKLIRCVAGAIFDVGVDLRRDSPTYLRHSGVELTAENRLALYIPPGCAHGFQTLRDDTETLYMISAFHEPASGRGARFDDPAFEIAWPLPPTVVLERDRRYPDWTA